MLQDLRGTKLLQASRFGQVYVTEGLRMYIYIYIYMYVCVCIYIYICMYIYIYIYVCVYIYIYMLGILRMRLKAQCPSSEPQLNLKWLAPEPGRGIHLGAVAKHVRERPRQRACP